MLPFVHANSVPAFRLAALWSTIRRQGTRIELGFCGRRWHNRCRGGSATKQRHTIQAVIRPGDESGYVAECIDVPVVTQGATVEESLSNLQEAVGLLLDREDLRAWNLADDPTIMVMIELEPRYA